MTFFDFDTLEIDAEHLADPSLDLGKVDPESERLCGEAGVFEGLVCTDSAGMPRGACSRCRSCVAWKHPGRTSLQWLHSGEAVTVCPLGHRLADRLVCNLPEDKVGEQRVCDLCSKAGGKGAAGLWSCVPCGYDVCGICRQEAGRDQVAASRGRARGGKDAKCQRCGCPAEQHASLRTWWVKARACAQRLASNGESVGGRPPRAMPLPSAAVQWSAADAALFSVTRGRFDPRLHGCTRGSRVPSGQRLISVTCPTSDRRHAFHPLLYECFCAQTHEPKELVVIDSGLRPSQFLLERSREDPRLIYRFFNDQASPQMDQVGLLRSRQSWSLGLKRNLACHLADGVVIAHFDDDDLYAPEYLAYMSGALFDSIQRDATKRKSPSHDEAARRGLFPAAGTLSHWHMMDFSNQTFGFLDPMLDPRVPDNDNHRKAIAYGYGFSYVYTRATWELEPFPDVAFCEDGKFTAELMARGLTVELIRLPPGVAGLASHSYHPDSTSGGAAYVRAGEKIQVPEPFRRYLPTVRKVAAALKLDKGDAHPYEKWILEEGRRAAEPKVSKSTSNLTAKDTSVEVKNNIFREQLLGF